MLKIRVKQVTFESKVHNDNTKKSKLQDTLLGILKFFAIFQKIRQRDLGSGVSVARVMYLSMRIHPKSCHIFPLKVTTTLLYGSRKGAVGV